VPRPGAACQADGCVANGVPVGMGSGMMASVRTGGIAQGTQGVRRTMLLTAVVVLALAVGFQYIEQETLSAVSAVLGIVLGCSAEFRARRAEAAKDLDLVAKELAADVQREWSAEAARREVVESSALPVAWRPAESGLVEGWADVVRAARALPGGPPGDAGAWPVDVAGLEGVYTQIGEVFTRRVPTRRLVVLGEPGSGKSALLIRLLQELARPGSGGPVPVLFSLASWNPHDQGLKEWMAEQLRRNHNVGLRHPASTESRELDRAEALVVRGLVLPLLDGFDEIPPALHATALHEINRAWRTQPLVLASRTDAYRAALSGPDARRLDGAAGIRLVPLTPGPAADYLRSGLPHAERWDAVIARLGSDTPVGQVLSTPLGLFLARTIYAPPPRVGATEPAPHPDELCDTTLLRTRDELERHLFSRFITAVYDDRDRRSKRPHWSAQQARHTLATLARHLEDHRGGSTDLAWWELSSAAPAEQRADTAAWVTGLIGAVTVGLVAGLSSGLGWGLAGMLGAGLVCGFASGFGLTHAGAVVYPSSRFRSVLNFGLVAAFVTAFVVQQFVGARRPVGRPDRRGHTLEPVQQKADAGASGSFRPGRAAEAGRARFLDLLPGHAALCPGVRGLGRLHDGAEGQFRGHPGVGCRRRTGCWAHGGTGARVLRRIQGDGVAAVRRDHGLPGDAQPRPVVVDGVPPGRTRTPPRTTPSRHGLSVPPHRPPALSRRAVRQR